MQHNSEQPPLWDFVPRRVFYSASFDGDNDLIGNFGIRWDDAAPQHDTLETIYIDEREERIFESIIAVTAAEKEIEAELSGIPVGPAVPTG